MLTSVIFGIACVFGASSPLSVVAPALPATSTVTTIETQKPIRLVIPAINLDNPIVEVGVNSKNEMDVPSGTTNNVGWYKDGTLPGEIGTATLDAHVYAAFAELHNVPAGSDVFVEMTTGRTLHFIIETAETFALKDVPVNRLFYGRDKPRLTLITCAGTLTPDRSTYTKRLILFATLAG